MQSVKQYTVKEITVAYQPGKALSELPVIATAADAVFHLMEGFDRDTMALNEQFVDVSESG